MSSTTKENSLLKTSFVQLDETLKMSPTTEENSLLKQSFVQPDEILKLVSQH